MQDSAFRVIVYGIPRVKKNGQRSVIHSRTGKMVRVNTPQYKQWHKDALLQLPWPHQPLSGPLNLKCTFYMPNYRRVDLSALYEGIQDVLVEVGMLEDDYFGVVAGHDGSRVQIDPDNPRIEVLVTKLDVE